MKLANPSKKKTLPGYCLPQGITMNAKGVLIVSPVAAFEETRIRVSDPICTKEAAKITGLSVRQILNLCDTGFFKAADQNGPRGHWRISKAEVIAYKLARSKRHSPGNASPRCKVNQTAPKDMRRRAATPRHTRRRASAQKTFPDCSLNPICPSKGGIELSKPAS